MAMISRIALASNLFALTGEGPQKSRACEDECRVVGPITQSPGLDHARLACGYSKSPLAIKGVYREVNQELVIRRHVDFFFVVV